IFEGKAWYHDGVIVNYKNFKIIFDYYEIWSRKICSPMTRCYAEFTSADDFRFKLSNETFASEVAEFFGAQDVKINRPEIDEKFVIRTNNEFKVKRILANQNTRNRLSRLRKVNLEISDDNGIWDGKLENGKLQLSLFFEGKSKEQDLLLHVLGLFKEILDDLKE